MVSYCGIGFLMVHGDLISVDGFAMPMTRRRGRRAILAAREAFMSLTRVRANGI
jgi:hypothetical protein